MAQVYAQTGLSPYGTQALPVGHVATPPAHVAAQAEDIDWKAEHTRLVEMFEAAEDASRTNREKAERDIDYLDHKQWTEEEVKKLNKRGQPAITKNRIKRKIDYLQGLERQQRTDPRALPRTPQHEEDAHSVTDALRAVCQENRYDQVRSRSWKDIISCGWGGVEVTAEFKPPMANPRIIIRRCQWDRMFWDPYSSEENYSDARYLGLVLWMDREDAVNRYGADAAKVFDETTSSSQVGTFDDKPKITTWVSWDKRYRIRVVQIYYQNAQGEWWSCEFTKGGYLQCAPSVWEDDQGKPEHPYAWRSAFVDRDNNRYGVIRGMIDVQDEVNKRSSKALHLFSVRQTFRSEEALGNQTPREMRENLAKPDGEVVLRPGAEFGKQFGIIPTGDMANGQFELLQLALAEMELEGPNAAMLGKGPASQSGRAILANQQGGGIEASPLYDALRDMDHEVYRKVWKRIRQFWKAEEWVRVTDDMKNLRWVGINAPAMQEMPDPMTGQVQQVPVMDPATGQPKMQNAVAQIDIDIIIDDAPHVGTMQAEQFQQMAELAKFVPSLQALPPEIWIKMSDIRNKAELVQAIEDIRKQQQPDSMQIEGAKAELQNTHADTANKAAQAKRNEAQAQATIAGAGLKFAEFLRPEPQQQPANGNGSAG